MAAGVAISGRTLLDPPPSVPAEPLIPVSGVGVAPAVRGQRIQVRPFDPIPVRECMVPGELLRSIATDQRIVVLTFDDGPDPALTLAIANIMRDRGYEGKATFFQVGDSIRRYPWITRELSDRGFEIGNHSMRHYPYSGSLASQIAPTQDLIHEVTGKECLFFRSPGLTQSSSIQWTCARLGIINVFTDGDERDWISPRVSAWTMNSHFNRYLHPGYISLRHDGGSHRPTVEAMHGQLDICESRGYQVVSLSDALRARQDLAISRRVQGEWPLVDDFEGQAPGDTSDGMVADGASGAAMLGAR